MSDVEARDRTAVEAGSPSKRGTSALARTGEVFDLVRRGEARTTSEIAESMGVARSTVTERLQELFRLGLLVNGRESTSGARGRPAGILGFNERAGVTLVAQVGMSGTMVAVTDLTGESLWRNQVDIDVSEGPEAFVEMLVGEFERGLAALDEPRERVYGIGVGLPGDLEIATARAGTSGAGWSRYPFAAALGDRFGSPVFIDRDVNFMALGEHRSSWPHARVLLCVKVGTVIASGLVIDGRVVQGASSLSGEIGHTKVAGGHLPCACGSSGCLNTIAGGAALATQLRDSGIEATTSRDVARLANEGVPEAGRVVRQAGQQVGEVLAGAIHLLNPDVISVWGYLVDAGDQFLAGVQEAIFKSALPSSARAVDLDRAHLGDDAGLRGAALTVIEHALAPEAIDVMVARPPLAATP